MNQAELTNEINIWKNRLGIAHWTITLVLVDRYDVKEDAWSTIHINNDEQQATLTLAKQRTNEQHRKSIAHELIHILLYPLWLRIKDGRNADEYARAEEQAIRKLVDILCL